MSPKLHLLVSTLILTSCWAIASGQPLRRQPPPAIPENVLLNIIRHEDERRWDDDLQAVLASQDAKVRKRAALAAGRIGNERAVPVLAEMLLTDRDAGVQEMAAFGLGEIESPGGSYALVTVLKNPEHPARARAIEALGKITAAMITAPPPAVPGAAKQAGNERLDQCKAAIVDALRFEADRKPHGDRLTIILGLTAVLRIKPDGAGPLVTRFLDDADSSIVAAALNTMARLRLKDAPERARQLLNHDDPIVRANAARVIGAAEPKEAFDAVLDRALHDQDLRVRVSAVRSLASLKDPRAAEPLLSRGTLLIDEVSSGAARNESLEIAATLGRLLPGSDNEKALSWLRKVQAITNGEAVEVELALVRIAPQGYLRDIFSGKWLPPPKLAWKRQATVAQGLAELSKIETTKTSAQAMAHLHAALCIVGSEVTMPCVRTPTLAVSEVMRAYASFKPVDLSEVLRNQFNDPDVVVRATAAELLGEQSPNQENTQALIDALPRALRDQDSNDAALATLQALAKQKSAAANDAIKTALNSSDHLIRRRAVALLKANGAGDFSGRIGTVQTRNTIADYRRAIARIGHHPTATVVTSRGSFTIEFAPDDAPLTVDNFIQLAKRGYFNGQTIPRVVPNFVVQAGDPRGDQNGGPGYQIRCEINENPYERAAVGMALSGKDTGGSQWFVTHSPQPHLDGGYTVFGRVIRGMDVVDNIGRGDIIQRVVINER
jgi:cyclophilin family peptidyl-prolyl cis-trans isomerase/HEAT repeat protein